MASMTDKLNASRIELQKFLEDHNVKDYQIYDDKQARQMMALSTFKVWKAWRLVSDVLEGNLHA